MRRFRNAVKDVSGISDEDKEEVVTNTLANQIHIVLRDNPWLLKFIQESLSKTKHKEK